MRTIVPHRLQLLAPPLALDVKVACRAIAKHPSVTVAVVLTIGLAVAANTALFSVFDGLLFRPLPYEDAARIVHLQLNAASVTSLTRDQMLSIGERVRGTPSLLHKTDSGAVVVFDPSVRQVTEWQLRARTLSAEAFDLLGVRAFLGRTFVAEDAKNPPFTVLLGYDVWRTRFGGDASIINTLIELPGTSSTDRWRVVGVMPPGFAFPDGANFWIPVYATIFEANLIPAYARLAPGVTIDALRLELPHVVITPLRERVRPAGAFALGVLLVATALLLLVAWVQIATLLFARATGRVTEIGVRLALGASRLRLVRQFAIEGSVLVLLALALAALATPALISMIVGVLPPEITLGQNVRPDLRAFSFAAVLSAVGLLVLTLLPIDLIRRTSPSGMMRGGFIGAVRVRATRFRIAMFVSQLAIATSLVYLTGVTLHSFVKVSGAQLGFDPAGLVAIRMPRPDGALAAIPSQRRGNLEAHRELVVRTLASLRELPGIAHVSGGFGWPLQREAMGTGPVASESDPTGEPLIGRYVNIMPGYPDVLGVRLVAGAEPTVDELRQTTRFALVNQSLARQLQRHGPVIGQIVPRTPTVRYRVVGIMPDVILDRPDRTVEPTMFVYLPPSASVSVVALVRLDPGRHPDQVGIQTVLDRIWGAQAPRPFTLDETIKLATADVRARTLLLGLISALCMPLTIIGVAGTLRYATSQRMREIAIELAMGAKPRDMEHRVVRQALTAAALALLVGLGMGIGIAQLMSATLFDVAAVDPSTIVVSVVLVLFVVWVAALLPARRAGRISPAEALRES